MGIKSRKAMTIQDLNTADLTGPEFIIMAEWMNAHYIRKLPNGDGKLAEMKKVLMARPDHAQIGYNIIVLRTFGNPVRDGRHLPITLDRRREAGELVVCIDHCNSKELAVQEVDQVIKLLESEVASD